MPPDCFKNNKLKTLISSNPLIFKCIRINRLLPWILNKFNINNIIYLIRHPCGVISSQLKHKLFTKYNGVKDFDKDIIKRYKPEVQKIAENANSEVEYRAITWSIDQYIPFHYIPNHILRSRFYLLSYENLISKGQKEMMKIIKFLGSEKWNENNLTELDTPSNETKSWSADHKKASDKKRLNIWKKRLNQDQINKILHIAHSFGFNFIDNSPKFNIANFIQY